MGSTAANLWHGAVGLNSCCQAKEYQPLAGSWILTRSDNGAGRDEKHGVLDEIGITGWPESTCWISHIGLRKWEVYRYTGARQNHQGLEAMAKRKLV